MVLRKREIPARPPRSVVLTVDEVALAFVLVARIDPRNYGHPEAKALIAKAVAFVSDPPDTIRVLP